MTASIDDEADDRQFVVVDDYLALSFEQRYDVMSQRFPAWLKAEPGVFPADHPTYAWACLVNGCNAMLRDSYPGLLCMLHFREFKRAKDSMAIEDFLRVAKPLGGHGLGWALKRKLACKICGSNREAVSSGYCPSHWTTLTYSKRRGKGEEVWRRAQRRLPPHPACSVPQCVHDGDRRAELGNSGELQICVSHRAQWKKWLNNVGRQPGTDSWDLFVASPAVRDSVAPVETRGRIVLASLPDRMQSEIRYGIYRHASNARRTQWQPRDLQKVIDCLVQARVETLSDPTLADLAGGVAKTPGERRIWADLPVAARSLSVNAEIAKSEGWFDPVIVGAKPFHGTQGQENRRKAWSLNAVSQRWLRDILWDHLNNEALKPAGKRATSGSVYSRITGFALLSLILRQNRSDHGNDPTKLARVDAWTVKETWDVWYREQIPIPTGLQESARLTTLVARTRHRYMSGIRIVLNEHRIKQNCDVGLESFILALPEYPTAPKAPRPRPLSFGDFQLLVDEQNLRSLQALDAENVGLVDIWLTQAFQGGRISETLKLRLGCVGLVGAAQPYIWRHITKANVVDYGMPCHVPVYQRLLRRQSITRTKLRARYARELATLDERGRAQLEAEWDRTMPLFSSSVRNPDLLLEVSQSWFRSVWTEWFEELGLSGITTHQTRATLATSLLNNGAPAALVRQLLGHFSEESLAHYARYNDSNVTHHLRQVWAAGPGMDKPGTIILQPNDLTADDSRAFNARVNLSVVPVEHGLCRYGPVVGGQTCPWDKNCTSGPLGPCEHFALTGADLAYWERKRDAAYHFAEGAPNEKARDYILGQWHPWEPVLASLREALDELGLLEEADKLDLRSPVQDYFNPVFSTGWPLKELESTND